MSRFAFGENWRSFLERLDDTRIRAAEESLAGMLEADSLEERSFLDIGCGSGLFSLAARRLGARVHSFDYDPDSVACAQELRKRFRPGDSDWTVEQGSVLDEEYMASLGTYDVVYAWGVLHHTGDLRRAMEMAARPVKPGGLLYLAIYNDQGRASRVWKRVKRWYNRSPAPLRWLLLVAAGAYFELRGVASRLLRLENPLPFRRWREKKEKRGMAVWHDLVDWVGGYPFEVAKPEEVFHFYRDRGFVLRGLETVGGGRGNNQYLFRRRRDGTRPTS